MTEHINAGDKNPAYAAYVGRVGALAVALGIGAAMASGHGLGLGVAYATEGDPSPDTSQDGDTNHNDGDGAGTTPPSPSPTAAPGNSSRPRSPLERIADVPKMIFNATGGAQRSRTDSAQPRLPRLSTVIENVASAVTNNLPKNPAPAQGAAPQGHPTADSGSSVTPRLASNAESRELAPSVTSLPVSVANEIKALVSLPSSGGPQNRQIFTPNAVVPEGVQRQAIVDNGQQDVVAPSVAHIQAPPTPPLINPVGVVTRFISAALAPFLAPGPVAPPEPPLLLGVLAWARREIQLSFCNRRPDAVPDVVTTGEVNPATGNVLTNDRLGNPDGTFETLTVTNPGTYTSSKGTLVLAADGSYTYTPVANASGQDVFTYTVSDKAWRPHVHGLGGLLFGGAHTDTGTLTINITPVNDAPTAGTPPPNQNAVEDTPFSYTIPAGTFTDPDGDTLTYTATGLPAGLTFNPTTRTISGTPTTPGNYTVAVTATDPSGQTASTTLALAVANTNDAPTAGTPPPNQNAVEDTPFSYTIPAGTFTDPDGDTLTYTATGLPAGLTFNPTTRTISGTPTTPGNYTVAVTATDPSGQTASTTLALAVANTNDAPTAGTPPPNQNAVEDTPFSYTIPAGTFTDPDGDTLTYTATGLPAGLTFNPTTRTISGTPTTPGNYTVAVTATDPSGQTASTTLALAVANTNDAPTAGTPPPNQNAVEDTPFSYTIPAGTFTDPDGDTLTYTATGLPAGLTFNPTTRTISGTPTTPGNYTVAVTATDPSGQTASTTLALAVANTNDAPTAGTPPPNQNAVEDTPFSYTIPAGTFTDPDGDTLTYTATGLPAGLTFNPTTRTISGTPTTPGNYTVAVTATDPSGQTASTTLALAVANTNDAPTASTPPPNQNAVEDTPFSYTIPAGTFTDPDGDTLTYTATGLPAGLTFNPTTRTISGTPTTPGNYTVAVTATDPSGQTASTTLALAVANTNDAPTAGTPPPNQNAVEDTPFSYTIPAGTFTDPDGDTLTYTATGLPAGLTFNPTTRTISGTPTTPGNYTVAVTATDPSGQTASTTLALAVANTNDAPTASTPPPNQNAVEDTPFSYTIPAGTFTDPDGDTLTYTATGLPAGLTFNPTTRTISGTPTTPGNYTVAVTATDAANTTATQTFTLAVANTLDGTLIATIPVGDSPQGIALNPAGTRAYVTNVLSNSVTVINTTNNTLVTTIAVGTWPSDAAVTPNGAFVYVTNRVTDNVSVINTANNTVVGTIPVGNDPRSIAFTADGSRAYVANGADNTVSVINTANNTVIATIPVGTNPDGVAVHGNRVYVTNLDGNSVSVIDTNANTVIATVPVGGGRPFEVAVTPNGARAYVPNGTVNTVSVIDTTTNTVVATVPVGQGPVGVTISPDGTRAYVTNSGSDTVSVIDTATNTVILTFPVGDTPWAVVPAADGVHLYVVNGVGDSVSVVEIA
ncbi:putative Ig domain-containing protein [Mycobacterium sp. ITM-2016-00318]|uniref:putative Ig domain-containing protein n=1 Tax=Mycobacterium sp. ITM-2016-00318 TaxID=2099693 RepID=UPI00287FA4C2|nr:putative Ig domain-containing protein [Mycobacterium sp. ITM-2016-00318]WNG94086.1 putative Ig domain-containing protein [Mycobacterium sp. ITM-2016-00318]